MEVSSTCRICNKFYEALATARASNDPAELLAIKEQHQGHLKSLEVARKAEAYRRRESGRGDDGAPHTNSVTIHRMQVGHTHGNEDMLFSILSRFLKGTKKIPAGADARTPQELAHAMEVAYITNKPVAKWMFSVYNFEEWLAPHGTKIEGYGSGRDLVRPAGAAGPWICPSLSLASCASSYKLINARFSRQAVDQHSCRRTGRATYCWRRSSSSMESLLPGFVSVSGTPRLLPTAAQTARASRCSRPCRQRGPPRSWSLSLRTTGRTRTIRARRTTTRPCCGKSREPPRSLASPKQCAFFLISSKTASLALRPPPATLISAVPEALMRAMHSRLRQHASWMEATPTVGAPSPPLTGSSTACGTPSSPPGCAHPEPSELYSLRCREF